MEHWDPVAAEAAYWHMLTTGIPAPSGALEALAVHMSGQIRAGETPRLSNRPVVTVDETRAALLGRIRRAAGHVARQTVYYAEVFDRAGLDPDRLEWDDVRRIPITPKAHLRDRPSDFVAADAQPQYRSFTGGTTGGRPIGLWWSDAELKRMALVNIITGADGSSLDEWSDLMLDISDSTQFLSMSVTARMGPILGAEDRFIWGRMHDPDATVDQLLERHRFGSRSTQVDCVLVFASYWGAVVEAARRRRSKAEDYALRFIGLGGEIATDGLVRRSRDVFGEQIHYDSYGCSETFGCVSAYRNFRGSVNDFSAGGYAEFLDADTGAPAAPGSVGTLVSTCLPPWRETTLLLRYDTEDLFQMPDDGPVDCTLPGPAVGWAMGKRPLSLRLPDGRWVFPRQVLEALEDVDAVPLPARCGYWVERAGVAVEVVAPGVSAAGRRTIGDSLERWGVPVAALHVRESRSELEHPYPLRCDGR